MHHVHQRLCMAFPSKQTVENDNRFLKPFSPEGFSHVHGPRTARQAFLFRVDPLVTGRAAIMVQSAVSPDWDFAFSNAGFLLAARPRVGEFDPAFREGERLRFRLLANPVRKVSKNSTDSAGKPFEPHWIGKDVPVPTAELKRWIERRAEPGWLNRDGSTGNGTRPGFRLVELTEPKSGYLIWSKAEPQLKQRVRRIRSALYEGLLEVTDAASLRETVISGIGPGKAFGCGLLSVASIQQM